MILLYRFQLLTHEDILSIPKSTRQDWDKKNLEQCFGYTNCAIYIQHFQDMRFAHKYSFTRYTLQTSIAIQKTIITLFGQSKEYKKLMRQNATSKVRMINDCITYIEQIIAYIFEGHVSNITKLLNTMNKRFWITAEMIQHFFSVSTYISPHSRKSVTCGLDMTRSK